MNNLKSDKRLIVALDVAGMAEVKKLVEELGDAVCYYKVGMELFYHVGSSVVTYLREQHKEIFLDLKLHDIPNTVAQGLSQLTKLGVSMLNVHAGGGYSMMKAASEAVKSAASEAGMTRPKLIAVTVLTSIGTEDWSQLNYAVDIKEQVVTLAKLAQSAGIDGVVASPREAKYIRETCGKDFLIVTPGVRPAWAAVNDQNRIATPKGALVDGANHLVVGRPITKAEDPEAAAMRILSEMREVK
ncbi:MAG: orotidine-5'-phosphate decarboxylase [Pelosinus sp.]|nr:orotidine-5'-phosphate decarboxylase [Pelosinus sp.]